MGQDIREFVAACPTCTRGKSSHRPPAGFLRPLFVPSCPLSHVALDFITGFPPLDGNTTFLTIVGHFSKAVHFVPLPKLPSATAQLLVHHVFRLHRILCNVVSDRGHQFTSGVWKAFCWALGAMVSLSSGYHPQTNCQTERTNQHLESMLRCVAATNPSWSSHLRWTKYTYNSQTSSATGLCCPFEVSLGYQPPLFPSQEEEIAVPFVQHHLHHCRQVWNLTRRVLLRTTQQNERFTNTHWIPARGAICVAVSQDGAPPSRLP